MKNSNSYRITYPFTRIWLASFLLTLAISAIITWTLDEAWINRLTDDKASFLSVYYNFQNSSKLSEEWTDCGNQQIVLIGVSDFCSGHEYSRADIAQLLNKIYELEPAVIGLDLFFPESVETTNEEDKVLEETILRCKDRLVVAAWNYHGGDSLRHSYFTTRTGVDYGTANSQSFYGLQLTDEIKDGTSVDRLVYKMAKKSGTLAPLDQLDNGIINYTSKYFIRYDESDKLTVENIQDKVVLVGDFKETRDIAQLPFYINGESSLPGTMIAAYQLNSIMSPSPVIHRANKVFSILACICFFILYSLYFVFSSIRENSWVEEEGKGVVCRIMKFILKPLLLIIVFGLCIVLSCEIVRWYQILIDMSWFVVASFLILDPITKICMMLFKKINPE